MATLLIVDDESACRRPLAALLRHEGYEVTEASDGYEGMQRLSERKHDLVLLDMIMPGVDGVAMLQAIRHQPQFADLPVLLVTAVHNPKMLARAQEFGVNEYIFKGDTPFCRMLELIKRQLGEHHVPRRRGRKPKNPRPDALPGAMNKPDRTGPRKFVHLELDLRDGDDW